MNQTDVFLREHKRRKRITYSKQTKPAITKEILNKWQNILNISADLLDVPSGLIMRINKTHLEVFLKNTNRHNPYQFGDKESLGHGLYCETVIGEDKSLHIQDAREDDRWKDNPDVALNMIAYYGLPLKWKDGEVFGTICVLDEKKRNFSDKHRQLLELFKEGIETDLRNLELMETMTYQVNHDALTGIANRRHIFDLIEKTITDYANTQQPFAIVMIDVRHLKQLNDEQGHQVGDEVLKAFAEYLSQSVDNTNHVGRIGGDEFLMILQNTNQAQALDTMTTLHSQRHQHALLSKYDVDFVYGLGVMSEDIKDINQLIHKADKRLIKQKKTPNPK